MLLSSLSYKSLCASEAEPSAKLCRRGCSTDRLCEALDLPMSFRKGFTADLILSDRKAPAMLARRLWSLPELLQASLSSMLCLAHPALRDRLEQVVILLRARGQALS